MDEETIVSLATPQGRAGIAVIRVSGKKTKNILKNIISSGDLKPFFPKPKEVRYCHFTNGSEFIDDGMVTYFQGPNSYTGEDVAELSIHSNPFIIDELIKLLISHGARQAMAGEFTYRAFKNGKIDLIQAESVNELINSNSKLNLQMKFSNLEGKFSKLLDSVKKLLIKLGVIIESSIEFGEDNYLEELPVISELEEINSYLKKILSSSRFNDILDRGFKIVIAGKVNVGKSSVFNDIVLENRSIVSPVPGTTRDFIDKKVYINGFSYEINDIAGFNKNTSGLIEDEGIKRSIDIVNDADAVIFVLDSTSLPDQNDMAIYKLIKNKKHIIIANKEDISDNKKLENIKKTFPLEKINSISVKEGKNTEVITEYLKSLTGGMEELNLEISVNQRQRSILADLTVIINNILIAKIDKQHTELIAEDIRESLSLIGKLTGEISTEDILSGIFSTFCIGK